MSAASAVQAALVAALKAVGLVAFDAPPVRGALPHVVVEEPVLGDWSTKTWVGREGRVVLRFHDAGERPVRLRTAIEVGEAAALGVAGDVGANDVGGGWRVVQLRLVRTRLVRSGDRWVGTSEFQLRMWRG